MKKTVRELLVTYEESLSRRRNKLVEALNKEEGTTRRASIEGSIGQLDSIIPNLNAILQTGE
jgi:hypothetical protein